MKTKITVTITVDREGSPAETFEAGMPPTDISKEKNVFPATVSVLEAVLSQMHRRYLPTVEEAAEHNASQPNDGQ